MEHETAIFSLLEEWEERRDRGAAVTPEELCAAAPHLAATLRRLIVFLEACDRLVAVDEEALAAAPAAVPAQIGKYAIQGELGHGGMGVVYRAWDPALCRTVALKMLRPATPAAPDDIQRLIRRFRQEGQVLARLRHEHIVPVYEAMLDDAGPYFVMEYVPGGSLADHRQRLTAAGPAVVADFLERVARAVAHAHAHGVLHRDLKPGNILLDADGRPRVSDFGLAKLLEASAEAGDAPPAVAAAEDDTAEGAITQLTAPGRQPGTRAYMAPEQFDAAFGPIGAATDVWALGVILYELLAGRRPFPGSRWDELREQVCRGPVPPLGRQLRPRVLGRRLERVVRRCLEKDPTRRFRTAGDLADALHRAAAARLRRWLLAGGWAATLGLAVVGIATWHPPDPAANVQTLPAEPPDLRDRPEVQEAQTKLAHGEEVALINDGRPAAFHWAMGSESGKVVQRDGGTFAVHSMGSGVCPVELLPDLPPGRYRVDATLRHDAGDGHSVIGIYAAGSRCRTDRGWQNLFVSLTYADVGPRAAIRTSGLEKGCAQLQPHYFGESVTSPYAEETVQVLEARMLFDSARLLHRPPGWRTVSLLVDDEAITALWDGVEFHHVTAGKLENFRQGICTTHPDLARTDFAARPRGGLGILVVKGQVSVHSFRVRPLLPPERPSHRSTGERQ
jgi:serine/threonine-protein kinase